jgi:hypothetical protein
VTTVHAGGCLCGAVRYETQGPPRFVCICHCESCRRATGGGMVPWATFREPAFRLTGGVLATRRMPAGATRGHCASCGTSITYQHVERPGELDITLASLDDPASFTPVAHIWVEDKLPWLKIADDLPQYRKTVD